ncbi:glycerate kinase [Trichothermofontia sichuanensis B231]|uniref:glycerate kinase n=1 Tax=Trichothermofontia sichuanensis TaxID=3045816 RepID=UPI002247135F|nr:glycerate kinase [Trichothermofontia sichuanensis]UZQ52925.1 glycerate kinase [Trichothermofontia sichuanensis B231]
MTLSNATLERLLPTWLAGPGPAADEWAAVIALELADAARARALGITVASVRSHLEQRLALLRSLWPSLEHDFTLFPAAMTEGERLTRLWQVWLPLAQQLATWRSTLKRPLIQGILGVQGTGKTTLVRILQRILAHLGYPTLGISIDDFYKTYAERQRLQRQDPRLIWRGPPGTHDVELGLHVLAQLRQEQFPVAIPRFDKSVWDGAGDRTEPEWVWQGAIVLFEGWMVGLRPLPPAAFEAPPWPIVTTADRAFARDMNQALQAYLPLWAYLDRLMVLHPHDYRLSQQWRQQAEQQMRATGKAGMSEATIAQFVEYFWKALHPALFIPPLLRPPNGADLVLELDDQHRVTALYSANKQPPHPQPLSQSRRGA